MGKLANHIKVTAIITVKRKDGTVEEYRSDEMVIPMTEEHRKFIEEQKKKAQEVKAEVKVKTDVNTEKKEEEAK